MEPRDFEMMNGTPHDIAWCPGCGNYAIRQALMGALTSLGLKPQEVVMVSGIGQAAKMPHYLRVNFYNGLHGRSLPAATAIKAVNPQLTVIAESGDGCMYGEGGNHLVHAILRNPDITMIAHNNMVYGLTKGQASPTSRLGLITPMQPSDRGGVTNEPLNPLALAIALNASFVARAFIGDLEESRELMEMAINHKGFALLDIFQPCVTYNRVNTFQWFKENTYYLDDSHNPTDRVAAFAKSIEGNKFPLGVIYVNPKPTFEEASGVYATDDRPLFKREVNWEKLSGEIKALA
ncbi:MAG: thiamine pyrophosphate-dependent enzyme [Candidatus Bathyarchaeota archaeon]|nr:thiamine pyrophosphate-dependent enzyme [Candidatus Bathyarchaeota archaeon]